MRVLYYNEKIILQPETEFEASYIKGRKYKAVQQFTVKDIKPFNFKLDTGEYEAIGLTEEQPNDQG